MMAKNPIIMTTSGGNPVADNQNFIIAGPREIVQAPHPGAVKSKCLAVSG